MEDDPKKVTVFLLDDHELVREGVRQLLEADGTIEVVGEAGTCADAVARIRATRPQVAVLDVQLPDGTGVEVCRGASDELALAGDNFNTTSPYGNQGTRVPFFDHHGDLFYHGVHLGIEYIW